MQQNQLAISWIDAGKVEEFYKRTFLGKRRSMLITERNHNLGRIIRIKAVKDRLTQIDESLDSMERFVNVLYAQKVKI